MKIAIIGAGHIGSAIITCLAQGHLYNEKDIIVSNPNIDKLERQQEHFPAIHITTDNQQAISEAEVIVLAINPWKVDEVLSPLRCLLYTSRADVNTAWTPMSKQIVTMPATMSTAINSIMSSRVNGVVSNLKASAETNYTITIDSIYEAKKDEVICLMEIDATTKVGATS